MKKFVFLFLITGCVSTNDDRIVWNQDGTPASVGQSYFGGEPAWDGNCLYGVGCRGSNRETEKPTPYRWSLKKSD